MLVDGPTSKMLLPCWIHKRLRVDIGPSFVESRSPGLGTCQSMLPWFDPPTCRSCRVPQDLRARSVRQVPAGHRRLVVVMVGADISLPVLVVTIHLLAHAKDEGPTKYTRMIRPRQNHYLWKDLD